MQIYFLHGMPTPYYYIICKNLPELRELSLNPRFTMKLSLVSDIIRNAQKLEWFHLGAYDPIGVKPLVDSATFMEWAKTVMNRCNKTPLEMWLNPFAYNANHTLPFRASEGTFTLLMAEDFFGGVRLNIDYKRFKKNLHARCGLVNSF